MTEQNDKNRFVFPRWANWLLPAIVAMVLGGGAYMPVVVGLGGSPKTTDIGYQPDQPVPFSHKMHVGDLGMDCRYCHTTVEKAAFAAIPPTQTCLNCHTTIKKDSPKLDPIRESAATGEPVEWTKVHTLPDYAYFNHSAHINHGVGCVSCHGQVDQMEKVSQVAEMSMSWCLDCHRAPEKHLRPLDKVTDMTWKPEGDQLTLGLKLKQEYGIHDAAYMTSCSTCHR
jgi:hypothetical protein